VPPNNAKPSAATLATPHDNACHAGVEWRTSPQPVAYPDALAVMDERVAAIVSGRADELVWLLEHPPLYTAGTSARAADLLDSTRFPVFATGRGGQYTYHGPGQRIAYVMLDLRRRKPDVRWFVCALEDWLILALQQLGVRAHRSPGRVGIWVGADGAAAPGAERKIAAIGVRVRRWVTFHGISLNVSPDLEHFSGIVPCGLNEYSVTSLAELGVTASLQDVDDALRTSFEPIFSRHLG
jgi:lipoyl(octanoyl) transferase